MLATLADAPLTDPNLVYEPKYDGIRALVGVTPAGRARPAAVTITSRLGNDKTAQFPEIVEALAKWGRQRGSAAVLDGEIVALDDAGEPAGFQKLQDRMHLQGPREIERRAAARPTAFVAFDLLREGDEDLCPMPLAERRRRLESALATGLSGAFRLAAQVLGDGRALLEEATARGWEGLVVKDARSRYRPGARSLDWRKMKLSRRQEFVVGGFTEPRGSRSGLGALLLGVPTSSGQLSATWATPGAASRTRSSPASGGCSMSAGRPRARSRPGRPQMKSRIGSGPSSWPRCDSRPGPRTAICASRSTSAFGTTARRPRFASRTARPWRHAVPLAAARRCGRRPRLRPPIPRSPAS
jgi:bifunctional non-homologous end joining protein LigD